MWHTCVWWLSRVVTTYLLYEYLLKLKKCPRPCPRPRGFVLDLVLVIGVLSSSSASSSVVWPRSTSLVICYMIWAYVGHWTKIIYPRVIQSSRVLRTPARLDLVEYRHTLGRHSDEWHLRWLYVPMGSNRLLFMSDKPFLMERSNIEPHNSKISRPIVFKLRVREMSNLVEIGQRPG